MHIIKVNYDNLTALKKHAYDGCMLNKTDPNRDQPIPVLTSTEARKALGGISRSTEHRWMSKGILQPTHIGTRKHYLLADINDLITEGAS